MFAVLVQVAAGIFLVVWGGLCTALIGLALYNTVIGWAASLFPRLFPKTVFHRQRADMKKIRQRIYRLRKIRSIESKPACYGEAARNAIEEILSGGPDFFRKNQITPPSRQNPKP